MTASTPPTEPLRDDAARRSPHVLVGASAGSGKTFRLTNEFIGRLVRGEDPAALLATTFTRAAAAEVLHRVLSRLAAAALDETKLDQLRDHVPGGESLTQADCQATLERVVASMHRLSVLTIDAFFARLATAFAFELGLAPGWRVLDEDEASALAAEAVSATLRDVPQAELIELLRDLQGDAVTARAHDALVQAVKSGYAAFLLTADDAEPWRAIEPAGRRLDDAAIQTARAAVVEMDLPRTQKGDVRRWWGAARDSVLAACDAGDWRRLIDLGLVVKIMACEDRFDRAEIEDHHRETLAPLIEHARHVATEGHSRRTAAMRSLLERFDAAFERSKRAVGGLTFDDVPRLLLRSAATGGLERLFFRLDATVRHVLLDEFQDTSMSQYQLLEPMLAELLSEAGEGRSVFCVGDVKQSLYGWRGAEPTLLPALGERWPVFRPESLSKSWRSSPAVLDAVNHTFSAAATNPALLGKDGARDAAEQWDKRFDPHEAAFSDLGGLARLSVADELEPEDGANPTQKQAESFALETAVERVAEIRRRAPLATIAVLGRYTRDLRPMLGMLKERGIDASEQRGNPLVDAPAVAAAASLLHAVDRPGHTAGLFHVEHTPLGATLGLRGSYESGAAAGLLADLRARVAKQGVAPLLAEWYESCAPHMDRRGADRFVQAVYLAERYDAETAGGAAAFAELLESKPLDEPGRAPVRVMTIHASKGLEFDAVVLPLVGKAWAPRPDGVITTRDEPLGPVTTACRYAKESIRRLHPALEEAYLAEHRRCVNEELCCLYVAMTRAKRHLELVVPADRQGRVGEPLPDDKWRCSAAHMLRGALAPDAPASPGAELWRLEAAGGEAWLDEPRYRHDASDTVADANAEPAARTRTLRVQPGEHAATARLSPVSPSKVAERSGSVAAASLLEPGHAESRETGETMHALFEAVGWLEHGLPSDEALLDQVARRFVPPDRAKASLSAFRACLDAPALRPVFSRQAWLSQHGADDAVVHRERSFAVRDGQGRAERLMQGRFDRLVVGLRNGKPCRVEVVDFKTDAAAAGLSANELGQHAERHTAQMHAYRRAAARLYSLEPADVTVTLVFTAGPSVHRMT